MTQLGPDDEDVIAEREAMLTVLKKSVSSLLTSTWTHSEGAVLKSIKGMKLTDKCVDKVHATK